MNINFYHKYFILIFFLFSVFISCKNTKTNGIFYSESIIEADSCLMDTLDYFVLSFNPDNTLKMRGYISNLKKDIIWTEWYSDGKMRSNVKYEDGIILIDSISKYPLKIIFDKDSLKIGKKSYIRVMGLYPFESLTSSDNIQINALSDNSQYDYEIIPIYGDTAIFYYGMQSTLEHGKINSYAEILEIYKHSIKDSAKLAKSNTIRITGILKKTPIYTK